MGDSGLPTDDTDSFQPGRYSIWAYDRGDNGEPILLVAYEWEEASLRAVRVDCVWLHEDEIERNWQEHPEFNQISGGVEAALFARMIANGKVHRIGVMPPIGRYAEPPAWLA